MLGIGPFGRIGVGVVAGFWSWDDEEGKDWESGRLALVVLIGWAVAVIALVSLRSCFVCRELSTSLPESHLRLP